MKKTTALLLLAFAFGVQLLAQTPYCNLAKTGLFWDNQNATWPNQLPSIHDNVIYRKAPDHSGDTVSLKMDIYQPFDLWTDVQNNGTSAKRPLVVLIHGGSFVLGNEDDMAFLGGFYGIKGYVSASISYRLGWPNSNIALPCLNDFDDMNDAAYRAFQDARMAVKFLKEHAEEYSIDTNMVIISGISAGAITSLNAAYLDDSEVDPDRLRRLGSLGPATNAKAVLSLMGAMESATQLIGPNQAPLMMMHGSCDNVVPFGSNGDFFLCPNSPDADGSQELARVADSLNIKWEFHQVCGMSHSPTAAMIDTFRFTAYRFLIDNVFCSATPRGHVFQEVADAVTCFFTPSVPSCANVAIDDGFDPKEILSISPNPVQDFFTIKTSELLPHLAIAKIKLFDINGRQTKIWLTNNVKEYTIQRDELKAGIYLLQAEMQNGERVDYKLVIL